MKYKKNDNKLLNIHIHIHSSATTVTPDEIITHTVSISSWYYDGGKTGYKCP